MTCFKKAVFSFHWQSIYPEWKSACLSQWLSVLSGVLQIGCFSDYEDWAYNLFSWDLFVRPTWGRQMNMSLFLFQQFMPWRKKKKYPQNWFDFLHPRCRKSRQTCWQRLERSAAAGSVPLRVFPIQISADVHRNICCLHLDTWSALIDEPGWGCPSSVLVDAFQKPWRHFIPCSLLSSPLDSNYLALRTRNC